jgi:acyl-CoA hydrolase
VVVGIGITIVVGDVVVVSAAGAQAARTSIAMTVNKNRAATTRERTRVAEIGGDCPVGFDRRGCGAVVP